MANERDERPDDGSNAALDADSAENPAEESDEQLRARIRAASNAAKGLDLDALRRKRDAMRDPNQYGGLSVDVATLWSGRLADYHARRDPRPRPLTVSPGAQPNAVYSLPLEQRMRLWHGHGGVPEERAVTRVNTASNRRDSNDD